MGREMGINSSQEKQPERCRARYKLKHKSYHYNKLSTLFLLKYYITNFK